MWRLYEGADTIRVVAGPDILPPDTAQASDSPDYWIRSLHEHHYLGADGLPVRHLTHQVLQATSGQLTHYPYRFDTSALTIEVEEDGRLAGPIYRLPDDLYAIDIVLDEPLQPGDEIPIRLQALFHYEQPPRCEFRRATRGTIRDIGISVEFHPDKLPRHIWWAVWNGIDGKMTDRESVTLRAGKYVYRRLEALHSSVVGYTWEW